MTETRTDSQAIKIQGLRNVARSISRYLSMLATRHWPGSEPNVFLHSLPRSGSTWLMELIRTQPAFRACNEPLNLRKEVVRDHLGMAEWAELHSEGAQFRFEAYFGGFCDGTRRDPRFSNPMPMTQFYRPVTRRVVFKIIHGCEEHINWLADRLNGKILYLTRHPIPVSLSRQQYPKLDALLETGFRDHFTSDQLVFAEGINKKGTKLQRGVLDWCLRTSVALRNRRSDWTVISYEQLVLDPKPAVERMSENLLLSYPGRIISRLDVPSVSTGQSNSETKMALSGSRTEGSRSWLVERWQQKASKEDLDHSQEILDCFELDTMYSAYRAVPKCSYWIGDSLAKVWPDRSISED